MTSLDEPPDRGLPDDHSSADRSEAEPAILITHDLLDAAADGPRIDFEQGISHLPLLTLALIAINVAVFIWQVAAGALENEQAIVRAGALRRQEVWQGEYWRLASSVFLHADAMHLVGNCLVLYIVGMACEHAFGTVRSLAIYLASGLAGSLLSVLFEPGPIVGASGAIFGVLGCVTIFLRRYRRWFFVRDARVGFVLTIWALYQLGTGLANPQIANLAHLGGLLCGSALVLVLRPRLVYANGSSACPTP